MAAQAVADVTLRAKDGTFVINGPLVAFEDGTYRVSTSLGELVVEARLAECEGADCPPLEPENQNVRIGIVEGLDPAYPMNVLGAYFEMKEMRTVDGAGPNGGVRKTVTDAEGQVLGEADVFSLTPAAAFQALRNDEIDLLIADRRASNDEVDAFLDAGKANLLTGTSETIIGADAIVIAVSPENPVRSLTASEVEGIFSGLISNWSEVGGIDAPIAVYAPGDASSVAASFRSLVLDPAFSDYGAGVERGLAVAEIEAAVAADPAAIGLTTMSQASKTKSISLVGACGIETNPNRFNLLSENYPLSQRLYAYQNGGDHLLAKAISAFSVSPAGQSALSGSNYVGIAPDVVDLGSLGRQFVFGLTDPESTGELQNLRDFGREVLRAERLSTTFRFATGSSQLDNKARADARLLVELLERPEYRGAEVLLVGFTDGIGASDVNKVLSQRRADQVLSEIAQVGSENVDLSRFATYGFGESFAVACNDEDAGRDLNRRVEVWLR